MKLTVPKLKSYLLSWIDWLIAYANYVSAGLHLPECTMPANANSQAIVAIKNIFKKAFVFAITFDQVYRESS